MVFLYIFLESMDLKIFLGCLIGEGINNMFKIDNNDFWMKIYN